ncbi:MAG TPA: hypothetical protein PLR93_03680 [Anaerolineales bacterium]|nr:hypothetical protein [Anaerolineales bacterium]HNF94463.1 hypothetical protein [Anaerolineales bacterium]HNH26091.1 hypothetical protein [Anaerolineales bacterium]HNM36365.1 hypothetical protein [Anaerolineales bacterium]
MQTDPASLDPEERLNKFYALLSAGFGVLSLCAGLIPMAGTALGIAGIVFGLLGRRSENKRLAVVGIILSIIGVLTAIIYSILLYRAKYGA